MLPKKDFGEDMADRVTRGYVDTENITLKEYITQHLKDQKEYFLARLFAIEEAIDMARQEALLRLEAAKDANERRLEVLNEFRKTVEDWTKNAASRESVESLRKEMLSEVEKTLSQIKSLDDSTRKELDNLKLSIVDLKETRAELRGKASQSQTNMNTLFTGIATLIAIISIILQLTR